MILRALYLIMAVAMMVFAILMSRADARDPTGKYANSPNAAWYKQQHNSQGEWCCDESDGHPYYGDYKINEDGSVTVERDWKPHVIPAYMVLNGPNPTGHAVWWYLDLGDQHRDYCFAPGTLS